MILTGYNKIFIKKKKKYEQVNLYQMLKSH